MIPEFHPIAFDVEVWEMESVFLHVTLVPTATSSSSGEKALFPRNCASIGIDTDDAGPPGDGAGDGVGAGAVGGGE
jgi:hypothetical protein